MTFPRLNIDGAIGMAMQNGDDSFEQNDSLSAARTLNFSGDSAGASNLRLLAGDNDFYKFTLSSGARVDFSLNTDDGSQPNFELYSGSGTKIATIGASSTRELGAGTYVLKVSAFSYTMSGTYSIEIDRTSDDVYESNNSAGAATKLNLSSGHAHLSGLRLIGGNNDYYSFTLSGQADVSITLGYSGASTFPGGSLLNSSQAFVESLNEGVMTCSLKAGTYYIAFSSSQTIDGTYSLDVSASGGVSSGPPKLNGTYSDIAIDSHGTQHIAYYDSKSHTLRYVTHSSAGVWSNVQIVDKSLVDGGQYVSIAIDRKGLPGIAYYDAKNQDLKYAHKSGSNFSVTKIDTSGNVGEYPSLAYSTGNKPAISYYSRSGGNLKFALMGKSKWALSTVDSAGDTGRSSSLALNSKTGAWGIGYLNNTGGVFRYAERNTAGKWKLATVDDTKKGGGFISLAFDNAGHAAMSYFVADGGDLRYAHFDGRKWTKQALATKGSQGKYSNLMIDSAGSPSIYYYNQTSDAVMLASSRAPEIGLFPRSPRAAEPTSARPENHTSIATAPTAR